MKFSFHYAPSFNGATLVYKPEPCVGPHNNVSYFLSLGEVIAFIKYLPVFYAIEDAADYMTDRDF